MSPTSYQTAPPRDYPAIVAASSFLCNEEVLVTGVPCAPDEGRGSSYRAVHEHHGQCREDACKNVIEHNA